MRHPWKVKLTLSAVLMAMLTAALPVASFAQDPDQAFDAQRFAAWTQNHPNWAQNHPQRVAFFQNHPERSEMFQNRWNERYQDRRQFNTWSQNHPGWAQQYPGQVSYFRNHPERAEMFQNGWGRFRQGGFRNYGGWGRANRFRYPV